MLANIAKMPPKDEPRQAYDFSHHQDHLEIVQKINASMGLSLPTYAIYPRPDGNSDGWARLHLAYHEDMAKALGTPQTDLGDEKAPDWAYRNYQEHLAVRTKLGI